MTRAPFSVAALGPDAQRQIRDKLAQQQFAPSAHLGLMNEKYPELPKPPKYGNVKTIFKSAQGFERNYDSKLEARVAERLDSELMAGDVAAWLPQIPILLPGGVRLVVDFLVFYRDGSHRWLDAKGRETQASINKRKQAMALYGINVEIVR